MRTHTRSKAALTGQTPTRAECFLSKSEHKRSPEVGVSARKAARPQLRPGGARCWRWGTLDGDRALGGSSYLRRVASPCTAESPGAPTSGLAAAAGRALSTARLLSGCWPLLSPRRLLRCCASLLRSVRGRSLRRLARSVPLSPLLCCALLRAGLCACRMPPRGRRVAGGAPPGAAGRPLPRSVAGAAVPRPEPRSLLNLLLFAAPRATPGESRESRQERALSVPALAAIVKAESGPGAREPPLRAVALSCAISAERFEVNGEARYLLLGAWPWLTPTGLGSPGTRGWNKCRWLSLRAGSR